VKKTLFVAVISLLIFAGSALAAEPIEVKITPQHLSLSDSYVRFVRCKVASEYEVGNVAAYSLATEGANPILAVKVESHIEEHDTTVVFFFVDHVRVMLAGRTGDVELTLSIDMDGDGEADFVGSDTITLVD